MFFELPNSRSFIGQPAKITGRRFIVKAPPALAGTSFDNALEDTTARFWVPGMGEAAWDAGDGNTIGLSGIGLARCRMEGATIALRHRSDPDEPWEIAAQLFAPAGTKHLAEVFGEIEARYWSLLVLNPPAGGSVGWLWLGEWLQLPRGPEPPFTPPGLDATYEVSAHLASAAQSLGARAQQTGGQTTLRISSLPLGWLRSSWEPVRRHLAQGRSLLLWPDTSAGAVGLVQAAGSVPVTQQITRSLGTLSIPLRYLPA